MTEEVRDGDHRPLVDGPVDYKEFSRTSSGWTISVSRSAPFAKQWRITHPLYGERFFARHDEILTWTCEHQRTMFELYPERYTLRSGADVLKEISDDGKTIRGKRR